MGVDQHFRDSENSFAIAAMFRGIVAIPHAGLEILFEAPPTSSQCHLQSVSLYRFRLRFRFIKNKSKSKSKSKSSRCHLQSVSLYRFRLRFRFIQNKSKSKSKSSPCHLQSVSLYRGTTIELMSPTVWHTQTATNLCRLFLQQLIL